MKRIGLTVATLMIPAKAWAVAGVASESPFVDGIIATLIYGLLGIVMASAGYKVVDLLTPGDLGTDIVENNKTALAILAGSMIMGICFIIGCAIVG